MLKETPLKVFQEDLLCDECGERCTEVRSIHDSFGQSFSYIYKCENQDCNNTREVITQVRYPRLIYKIAE